MSVNLIDVKDLDAIAIGAALYGTGGGGDPHIGKLLAQRAIRAHGPARLITLDELRDDDLIISVAMIGAPTVMLERLAETAPLVLALRQLEAKLGRKAAALFSGEVGGMNSVIPFSVAAELGLPLVDGDTMGRAFPKLDMTLCALHGIDAAPLALADEKGNGLVLDTVDVQSLEGMVRALTMEMGGSCYSALYSMTVAQARKSLVLGSISMTQRTGKALFEARERHLDPVAELVRVTDGHCLFKGKVIDLQRTIDGRWSKGLARITGLDEHRGEDVELLYQNEFLVARSEERILASTPDLICTVDMETGEPITAEQVRYGLRVAVLGLPCVPEWRTPAAIARVGPRAFGYDLDYRPVEQLTMDRR
ncbi:hypothetical protein CDN99_25315 [Roseateles aquatilis]|uniref:Hydantoinase n=1 Tax=Roseateles aquatilis TaxID=431061 RepID=A0A246IU81_9BURK|nr:DUF917 domain-containing protein [Roseateles aquatilis]OWQ83791.1 hypothetical protein CDN99_25315 [Roseateles aquatilis]